MSSSAAFNTMAGSLEESRDELRLIAEEQAALRRVATLVAQAVPTSEVFDAVTREVGLQCDADLARMERFEADRSVTGLATWTRSGQTQLAVGTHFPLEGPSIAGQVYETGRPARVDSFIGASGPIAREAQELGIRASVGCPIVVGGRTWGVMAASRPSRGAVPNENRGADCTVHRAHRVWPSRTPPAVPRSPRHAHASSPRRTRRAVASSATSMTAAQQSLVHAIITLKLAQRALGDEAGPAVELVGDALAHADRANTELRELAHGILPATLSRGLGAGIETLVSRLGLPVSVDVTADRVAPELEATAYFIVAEALTNTLKHARASSATVIAAVEGGVLRLEVRDDGVGGVRTDGRSGLLGLADRVGAMNGDLRIDSPPGVGTTVAARLPLV